MIKRQQVQVKDELVLGGGIIAAITATICCIGPLVLLSLGISGAWISNLTAFEPYRPYSLIIAAAFITWGFIKVYKKPKAAECNPGTYCAKPSCVMPRSDLINKIVLWIAIVILLLAFLFPYIISYFY